MPPLLKQPSRAQATLPLSSRSTAAVPAFWRGYVDLLHHFEGRAIGALDSAVALDSTFGLARALRAHPGYLATATRFSRDQRADELRRGVADAERAGAPRYEILLARAWAAQAAGETREAAALLAGAAQARVDDPFLALEAAKAAHAVNATDGLRALREVAARFSTFAPAYMPLAYALEAAGDSIGALAAAQRYRDLAPDQPYAHYVFARMLANKRRYDDAAAALTPTVRLPRSWFDPSEQLATTYQLAGRAGRARAALREGIAAATTPLDRVSRMRYAAVSFAFECELQAADSALLGAAIEAERSRLLDHAAMSLRFAALVQGQLRRPDSIVDRVSRAARNTSPGDSVQQLMFAAQAFALGGMTDSVQPYLAALVAAAQRGDAESMHRARLLAAMRDARSGRGRQALDTLQLVGSSTGAPMVFIARDDAYAAIGDTTQQANARAAWLTTRDVNLRSIPLALAWCQALGAHFPSESRRRRPNER